MIVDKFLIITVLNKRVLKRNLFTHCIDCVSLMQSVKRICWIKSTSFHLGTVKLQITTLKNTKEKEQSVILHKLFGKRLRKLAWVLQRKPRMAWIKFMLLLGIHLPEIILEWMQETLCLLKIKYKRDKKSSLSVNILPELLGFFWINVYRKNVFSWLDSCGIIFF